MYFIYGQKIYDTERLEIVDNLQIPKPYRGNIKGDYYYDVRDNILFVFNIRLCEVVIKETLPRGISLFLPF